ncbi:MAG: alpha/beta hydrolase [Bacteroides sp.]|nr:alpha/beta hydrolase [Bacteroides sp.]
MKESIRKYGKPPFQVGLLHGGPGASGEMKPVGEELSRYFGVLEFLQTKDSIDKQIQELFDQITTSTREPITLVGYSWGAWLSVLFSSRFPDRVHKLILISSGAFDDKYNPDLMKIRLSRLNPDERKEAKEILVLINSGEIASQYFQRFGQLMEKADSYKLNPKNSDDEIKLDINIYQKVWNEAEGLRKSKKLLQAIEKIHCPVVGFHGEYDPHPAEGVEKPLSERLVNFRMVKLSKCGHTPWKEEYARDLFYKELEREIII